MRAVACWLAVIGMGGCTSAHPADAIHLGDDQYEVLEMLGAPSTSYRHAPVYPYLGSEELLWENVALEFCDGRVASVSCDHREGDFQRLVSDEIQRWGQPMPSTPMEEGFNTHIGGGWLTWKTDTGQVVVSRMTGPDGSIAVTRSIRVTQPCNETYP